jgi:molybdopterin synthase catalytic subunit
MFRLSDKPLDASTLIYSLASSSAGCCVTFEGWVRDNNESRQVTGMEYEAYSELALKEGEAILEEAGCKFDITAATCVHRTGSLKVGDVAVWIGVSAPHREDGFAACRYIIDEIKKRIPIWKKEQYADGDARWIES